MQISSGPGFGGKRYEDLKESTHDWNIECDMCNHVFHLEEKDVKNTVMKNEKEEKMKVTYFVCPSCNAVYPISIIDEEAARLHKLWHNSMRRINIIRKAGKLPSKKSIDELTSLKEDYVAYVNGLKAKYAGNITLE